MQITFKITNNTAHSDHLNFRSRTPIKRILRFQKYIAVLSDDLYLYSRKETFYIKNVVYIDDTYFYIREGKKVYRLTQYYGQREEVCMKDECSSDEMVMATRGVSVDELVYRNYTRVGDSREDGTELVGIYDRHFVLKKGAHVFYRQRVFDAMLAHLYRTYLVLVHEGAVLFVDLKTFNSHQISYRVTHGIRTKCLNCDTFLKIDGMVVYGRTVVSSNYRRVVIRDLMHELIARAKDRENAYRFVYLDSLNFEALNAQFDRHFERCRGMPVQDFRGLLQKVLSSDLECLMGDFVQFVRSQEMDLKGITQNVILKRGVRRVFDEIFLIMVFYKITGDEFFFNLMRLRFLYDAGDEGGSFMVGHPFSSDRLVTGPLVNDFEQSVTGPLVSNAKLMRDSVNNVKLMTDPLVNNARLVTGSASVNNSEQSVTGSASVNSARFVSPALVSSPEQPVTGPTTVSTRLISPASASVNNIKPVTGHPSNNTHENKHKIKERHTKGPSKDALTAKNASTEKLNVHYERLFFYDRSVCIDGMVKKHRAQKDVESIKKILYESKIRFDAEDLEGKRKDAQNIRRHASLGDALVFFLSRRMGRKRLSDKLMNRNITKLNDVRALLAKRTYPLLSVLLADHVNKLREKSERRGPYSNERRKFYDFYYRLVHTIKYSEMICTYTPMSDPFLELVLNGFMFMNTEKQWVKRKLHRKDDCKPEEIFMSEVLKGCIDFEEVDLNGLVVVKDNQSNGYYYRVAGRLFYVCLWFVNYCERINKKAVDGLTEAKELLDGHTGEKELLDDLAKEKELLDGFTKGKEHLDEQPIKEKEHLDGLAKEKEHLKDAKRREITRVLLRFCLEMEEKMHRKKHFQIIFDYALIALSVINTGTCDLDVLRIVRRKILETKDAKFLVNRTTFYVCCDEGIYVTSSLDYGRILKYKMCLGILCSGLGNYRLKERMSTVKYLIISFYPVWPVAIDDHKDYTECRYVICSALERKPVKHSYRVVYDDEYDKKYRLDILSDYCEKNEESVEEWEHLIDLMLEMK